MASIINAATSGGLISTADTSGILQLQTASTTAVTVNASQNVGIGTSSPAYKLDTRVTGTGNVANFQSDSGPNIRFTGTEASGRTYQIGEGLVTAGSFSIYDTTGSAERLVLNSSGNLGLGVTPSAWDTGIALKAFQFSATGCVYGYSFGGNNFTAISNNFYINSSGTGTYLTTNTASQYSQSAGQHRWFTAASGTAGNAISFTQAMTLDASGNLGVGTTSPRSVGGYTSIGLNNTTGVLIDGFVGGTRTSGITTTASSMTVGTITSIPLTFLTADTERARIDSSGRLLVGFNSYANIGNVDGQAFQGAGTVFSRNSTSSATQINFYNPNGGVGTINTSGTSTSYNTSSDYRLKNTIAPMTGALAKVALLKPVTYKWNCDGSNGEGFIAHELAEVVPDCVSGEKDDVETYVDEDGNEQTRPVYQGIDTSFLVATLTAALQEQQALINTLTDRISVLENK